MEAKLGRAPGPASGEQQRGQEREGTRHTDAWRVARMLLLLMLIVVLDIKNRLNVSSGQARYLILLLPLVGVAFVRLRRPSTLIRRPSASDAVLLILFVLGIAGTLYGILFKGTKDNMTSAFVPMIIAFTPLLVLDKPTEWESNRILKWLGWIGATYLVLGAVVNGHLVPSLLSTRQYRNALLLYVAIGVCTAIVRRRWQWTAVLLALTAVIFIGYPSGTFVLVTLAVLATMWMTKPAGSRLRPYFLGTILLATLVLALTSFQTGVNTTGQYFQAVGKANDNATRLALWRAGIAEFKRSPIVGTAFSGDTTVTTYRSLLRTFGQQQIRLPFHNDYILFMANGGIIGTGLLLLWIGLVDVIVLSRHRRFLDAGNRASADLLRVLLVGFNAFFCSAAFNPEFTGLGRSATIFSIYALIMLVGSPMPTITRATLQADGQTSVVRSAT